MISGAIKKKQQDIKKEKAVSIRTRNDFTLLSFDELFPC